MHIYSVHLYESSGDLVEVVSKKIHSSIICNTSYYSKIVCYCCILCT